MTETDIHAPRAAARAPLRLNWRAALAALAAAFRIRRERDTLAGLSEHMLRDIGVTRDQARRESMRRLWDLPADWPREF